MHEPARHLHLDHGELCALVCEIADAGDDPHHARHIRATAVRAFVQAALAQVPPGEGDAWRAHPLRLALWIEGPQPFIRPGDGA